MLIKLTICGVHGILSASFDCRSVLQAVQLSDEKLFSLDNRLSNSQSFKLRGETPGPVGTSTSIMVGNQRESSKFPPFSSFFKGSH